MNFTCFLAALAVLARVHTSILEAQSLQKHSNLECKPVAKDTATTLIENQYPHFAGTGSVRVAALVRVGQVPAIATTKLGCAPDGNCRRSPVVPVTVNNNSNTYMKISAKTKKQDAILQEGTYNATVSSVTGKPTEAEPTKVVFGFKVDGYDKELTKENPASFVAGSPLRADTETIIGRSFTTDEADEGIELKTLVGKKCQIAVFHKAGAGGRPKPAVSLVLPAVAAA